MRCTVDYKLLKIKKGIFSETIIFSSRLHAVDIYIWQKQIASVLPQKRFWFYFLLTWPQHNCDVRNVRCKFLKMFLCPPHTSMAAESSKIPRQVSINHLLRFVIQASRWSQWNQSVFAVVLLTLKGRRVLQFRTRLGSHCVALKSSVSEKRYVQPRISIQPATLFFSKSLW